ncbi:3-dehydroquinate synthase [Corallincola holothuriorum]|uniref:3-dehydroquinate synthase n=1 Tax=Corallincola holothuriorum TaxID=2282215 RepID=A0A368NF37_9GAMM|nr:3-dehydroquinate synthase [Corallincola holothuriorum]RCU49192.1 3-dehydroquinate synthase [Corallincola holothuriorum]
MSQIHSTKNKQVAPLSFAAVTETVHTRIQVSFNYPVSFTRDALNLRNMTLANLFPRTLPSSPQIMPVIDSEVLHHHADLPHKLQAYAERHGFNLLSHEVVRGGEICKQEPEAMLEALYRRIADEQVDRHSYLLVIGGGAVLDAVGYAAATAHRGIRLIRMPTTTLAQNDAGIGVKNAINHQQRKNYLGTFAPPFAVINDFDFLDTQSERDKRAGIAEAVKVALLKDSDFFNYLLAHRKSLTDFHHEAALTMIKRCASLHLAHIAGSGDPFEMGSARPLDFGHWSAHKLEALSGHRLRHGEAVAIGIALDSLYAWQTGRLSKQQCADILICLEGAGFQLCCDELEAMNMQDALNEFREHLGGNLCITLLSGIGAASEVSDIDAQLMQRCAQWLIQGHLPHIKLKLDATYGQ